MPILWILKTDVFVVQKGFLPHKTPKIAFSGFIFTIYDMRMRWVTRGYRGLQGVTGGYRGLQGLTWGYRGSQGVTGGYKGLQGVTGGDKTLQWVSKDYRNFLLTTTFPDTFPWSILHNNQS